MFWEGLFLSVGEFNDNNSLYRGRIAKKAFFMKSNFSLEFQR